jgi:hypothetical protein
VQTRRGRRPRLSGRAETRRAAILPTFRALGVISLLLLVGHSARGEEQVWADLASPPEGSVQRLPISLVEVRGVAGAGTPHRHDLVIVLDLSTSTRLPSGVDVDGDGAVGVSSPEVSERSWGNASPEGLCSDLEDTIAAAELVAARRLLGFVDPARTRAGIVAFGDRATLEAPLGSSPPELLRALDRLDGKHGWYGATHYGDAIRVALRALLEAPAGRGARRRRSILFLSDGYPTLPIPEQQASLDAVLAAREAVPHEVRLLAFALGPEAIRGRAVLGEMAGLLSGEVTELERPGDLLFHLPVVDLSEIVRVDVRNRTSGASARALRLFADGSFDGFVPLVSGANRIRVTAFGSRGGSRAEERTVFYEPVVEPTRDVEIEIERLRRLLHDRTREVELLDEMRRERAERRRELKIEVE